MLHNLSPPQEARYRINQAKGIGNKLFVASTIVAETVGRTFGQFLTAEAWTLKRGDRIRLGVGWQLLIRTAAALAINGLALTMGGDSTLLTFAAAAVLHSGYNIVAIRLGFPRLAANNGFNERDQRLNESVGKIIGLLLSVNKGLANKLTSKNRNGEAINEYIEAVVLLKELLERLANPRYGYLPEEKNFVQSTIKTQILKKNLFPPLSVLVDHIKTIGNAGNFGLAHDLLEKLNDHPQMVSPVEFETTSMNEAHASLYFRTLETLKRKESAAQRRISAASILNISSQLRLTNKQKIFLEIMAAIENNKLTPSFKLMSVIGYNDETFYQDIWNDELEGIVGSHWRPEMGSDEELQGQLNSLESMMPELIDEASTSENKFRSRFPSIDHFARELAELSDVPTAFAKVWLGMDDKKFQQFVRDLFSPSTSPVPMVINGWSVFTHEGIFNNRFRPGVVRSALEKFANDMDLPSQHRGGDYSQKGILRDDYARAYWVFVKKDRDQKRLIVLWFGTGQEAHAGKSTDASPQVRDLVFSRADSNGEIYPLLSDLSVSKPNNIFFSILQSFMGRDLAARWGMRLLPIELAGLVTFGWAAGALVDPLGVSLGLMVGGLALFKALHYVLAYIQFGLGRGEKPVLSVVGFAKEVSYFLPYVALPFLVSNGVLFAAGAVVAAYHHYSYDSKLLSAEKTAGAIVEKINVTTDPTEQMALNAVVGALMMKGRVSELNLKRGSGGSAYWTQQDLVQTLTGDGQAVEALQSAEAKSNAMEVMARLMVQEGQGPGVRMLLDFMSFNSWENELQKTAKTMIEGLTKAGQPVLLLHDGTGDTNAVLAKLGITLNSTQRNLIDTQEADLGISMTQVVLDYNARTGGNGVPLASTVLVQNDDSIHMDLEGFQSRKYSDLSKAIQKALNAVIAVLQAA
jgi:hypothetical protein